MVTCDVAEGKELGDVTAGARTEVDKDTISGGGGFGVDGLEIPNARLTELPESRALKVIKPKSMNASKAPMASRRIEIAKAMTRIGFSLKLTALLDVHMLLVRTVEMNNAKGRL